MFKKSADILGECTNRCFEFAHLCEKVNSHTVSLYKCANKKTALTRPDANQE